MPLSAGLVKAISAGRDPQIAQAFASMDILELVHLLAAYGSFMSGVVDDTQLGSFASDIRRARAPETNALTRCGGYADFAAGPLALPLLRGVIYIARNEFALESLVASKPPPPLEDEAKDLPSDAIDALRSQLAFIMGGVACPRGMRLTPALLSRMSRAAKKGGFYIPYVVHMRFAQQGGDRVAAVIAKAAGVTVEAIFDDFSLADIGQEVRLVADFLHLAWCRSLEAAAAYSTFDAPAAMALAKVARQNLPDATEFLLMDGTKAVPFAPPKFFLQHFDRLCVAARSGMSIAQLDSVDRAVLDAVGARVEEGYFCGAAFQYVIDSRSQLFLAAHPHIPNVQPDSGVGKRGREQDAVEVERLRKENGTLQSRLAKGGEPQFLTLTDEREPCANYNSRGGCQRGSSCKYSHVCNYGTKFDSAGKPTEFCRATHTRSQHP